MRQDMSEVIQMPRERGSARHLRATEWAESGNLVGGAFLHGRKHISTPNRYARPNQAARRVLELKELGEPHVEAQRRCVKRSNHYAMRATKFPPAASLFDGWSRDVPKLNTTPRRLRVPRQSTR